MPPTTLRQWLALCALSIAVCAPAEGAELAHLGGQYFVAGEHVRVSAKGDDDIYAAGGEVEFEGAAGDHLFGAGGRVIFRDVRARDVVAAGGNVSLAGSVADDVLMAGNRISIARNADIGDSAVLAGNTIMLDGRVGGGVWAAAETLTVTGEVAGDLNAQAERMVIASGARIGGDLVYRSRQEATIASGAVIGGAVRFVQREPGQGWRPRVAFGAAALAVTLAIAVLAAALQGAVPRLLTTAAATVAERPWVSLGLGFAVLVATPVAVAILFASVVGAPLALVVLFAYLTVLVPAVIAFAYWLGVAIGRLVGRGGRERGWAARWGWTIIGLVVLGLVGVLPWVGGAALLIALLFGLGALIVALHRHLRRPVETLPPG